MSQSAVPPKPHQLPPKANSGKSALVIILIVVVVLILLCLIASAFIFIFAIRSVGDAAREVDAKNRCRLIAISLHSYHDAHNTLPPSVTKSEDGKPLHSWRTEILPFMEGTNIYQQVDRSKAWNDPANSFLFGLEVSDFQSPRVQDAQGDTTHFVAVVGKGTMFDPAFTKGVRWSDVTDGQSNTIMVIEYRNSKIPWYKPEDITVDEAVAIITDPENDSGTIIGLADASVFTIPNTIDEANLRAMFTRSGGDMVDDSFLRLD